MEVQTSRGRGCVVSNVVETREQASWIVPSQMLLQGCLRSHYGASVGSSPPQPLVISKPFTPVHADKKSDASTRRRKAPCLGTLPILRNRSSAPRDPARQTILHHSARVVVVAALVHTGGGSFRAVKA